MSLFIVNVRVIFSWYGGEDVQAIQFPIAEGDVPETLRRIRKKHGVDVIALFALRQGLAVHVITSADRPVSFIAGPVFNLGLAPRIEDLSSRCNLLKTTHRKRISLL